MTTSLNSDINVYTVIFRVLCTLFTTSMLPPESRDLKTMDEFKQNYHPVSNLNVSYRSIVVKNNQQDIDREVKFLILNLGAHERLGTTEVQQKIKVKQLFAHEGFSMQHLKNDIALLQLATPAKLSDKVNTVCLPAQGSRIPDGHKCYITGMFLFFFRDSVGGWGGGLKVKRKPYHTTGSVRVFCLPQSRKHRNY